jgi:signal transduction histidine kinase
MAIGLNGFAHRYDTPLCPFQLNDIINEDLCFLARFAHLQSIGLSISFSEGLPMIYGNPSLIQFIFANLFFYLLATLQPGGKITVSSGQEDSIVHFILQPEGKMHENRPEIATVDHDQELQDALRVVGSSLAMQSSDGTIRTIVCNIPISYEFKSKTDYQ